MMMSRKCGGHAAASSFSSSARLGRGAACDAAGPKEHARNSGLLGRKPSSTAQNKIRFKACGVAIDGDIGQGLLFACLSCRYSRALAFVILPIGCSRIAQ